MILFQEYRPDVDDYLGQHTQVLSGVLPRGDGWGPVADLNTFTSALPAACRGLFYARKTTDGSIVIFAATSNRLQQLNNTDFSWTPFSKVTALTSISHASPGVVTLNSHGLSNGDALVLSTDGTLPDPLVVGTVYYVVNKDTNTFQLATTVGGTAIDTTTDGSGNHSMTYFYTAVPTTDQWQFGQFGNNVVAVQSNTSPQVCNITSDTAFSNLGGSPPTARYVSVVGRFLVLAGLASNPTRVHWSDLDDITTWTAGTGFANFVDLPDGGIVRAIAGGEFGLIFQESVIRRMTFVPGAKPAFQIERITEDMGVLSPYCVARASERIFFVSQHGFHEYSPATGLQNIGKEKVDRTFLASIDPSGLQYLVGSSDPENTRVAWTWRSTGGTGSANKLIYFDYELRRWSPIIDIESEYLAPLVKPGITLESVDSVFGSNVDTLTISFDSIQASQTARLAAFGNTHKLGFFDGNNLEAVVETPEQGAPNRRVRVRGFTPRTDAATVYGSVRHRDNAQSALSQTSETLVNGQGFCPQNIDTQLARARCRIPASEVWTNIMGVEPDFTQSGRR